MPDAKELERKGERTLTRLVALLGAVDEALDVLRHLVHRVVAPTHALVPTPLLLLRRSAWLVHAHGTTRTETGATGRHAKVWLVPRTQGGHDVEVEVVRVRVVRDELRDLDARDEVLVRVRHEVVVLGLAD